MARLTIRVTVEDGQTVSKFRTTRYNNIVFHNDGAEELQVVIKGATDQDSPLCKGGNPVPSFKVPAGDKDKFAVCGDKKKWTEFKYSAQIGQEGIEDPIVIIERFKFFEHPAAQVGLGVVAGALLTVAVMKMRGNRSRPTG
ncbi:MAG: hypothetical protein ACREVI_09730 [Steroidobacteraceae bacterium]